MYHNDEVHMHCYTDMHFDMYLPDAYMYTIGLVHYTPDILLIGIKGLLTLRWYFVTDPYDLD